MTKYIYFASYRYHEIIPPLTVCHAAHNIIDEISLPLRQTGTGRTRVVVTHPIIFWADIEAMEKAIVEMHPEYESVIVTNYQLMREDAA